MPEEKDFADHLVAAARLAMREGMTKEQFQNNAEVFWDSWARFDDLASKSESN